MTDRLYHLLASGESRQVEFKAASRGLPKNLFETVCAFLNRDGGDIMLGVDDTGRILGVDQAIVDQLLKDFANAVNNPQILSPPAYLSLTPVELDGRAVLHACVPPSSQVHRSKGRIFDRNADGDFDITDNQSLVAALYARKQTSYSENTIYSAAELADLDAGLLQRLRRRVALRQADHPWLGLDDTELLQSARLYQKDLHTGTQGLTLAALLLFGTDTTVLAAVSHHRTDAILRRVNLDRYDDRDDIRTNLFDSYDRLVAFGNKHLPDPFHLEGDQRVSLRSRILREVVGNLLIHREYLDPFPAKLIIERQHLRTENGNKPHGHGPIDPATFSPFPKNPIIARVFKEAGLADELGSGVRRLYASARAYGGQDPELNEDAVFQVRIALPEIDGEYPPRSTDQTEAPVKAPVKTPVKTQVKTQDAILACLRQHPDWTLAEVAASIDKSVSAVERAVAKLRENKRLHYVGPQKGGHWDVLE